MKKQLILIMFVVQTGLCSGQANFNKNNATDSQLISIGITYKDIFQAQVPKNSNIPLDDAATYIRDFQANNDYHFPVSFLIDARTLTNYLNVNKFKYIHVYSLLSVANDPTTLSLALTPTDVSRLFFRINRDYTNDGANYYVFSNSEPCPCGVINDPNLDPLQPQAHFAPPPEALLSSTTAKNYITTYQMQYKNPFPYTANYPESFLIRADRLKLFLTNAQYQNPNNGIAYLQIYFGKDITQQYLTNQIKLIIVGVTADGHHVYYNENGLDYALEEVMPCPVCGITKDKLLDYDPSYYFNSATTPHKKPRRHHHKTHKI